MKKQSLFILLLCLSMHPVLAQRKMKQLDEDEAKKQEQLKAYEKQGKGFNPDKMVYGGNIGLSFYNGGGYMLAQPMVGYKILENTIMGTGFTYIYQSYTYNNIKYASSAYGPLVFARQIILDQFFLHAELQPINYQRRNPRTLEPERFWSNQAYVGGGLGMSGGQISVLYNLLYDENSSYYKSPWYIRVGFMF